MDDLRALYESLGFEDVQTYINSGNVIFKTSGRDMARLRKRIEDSRAKEIEQRQKDPGLAARQQAAVDAAEAQSGTRRLVPVQGK